MRNECGRGRPRALLSEVLPGGYAVHFVRCRGGFSVSVGGDSARSPGTLWAGGDVRLHRRCSGWILLCLEKSRSGLGSIGRAIRWDIRGAIRHPAGRGLVALVPPIPDLEQLKSHPAVAPLVPWNPSAVTAVKFDRDEMTIWVERGHIREACAILRDDAE